MAGGEPSLLRRGESGGGCSADGPTPPGGQVRQGNKKTSSVTAAAFASAAHKTLPLRCFRKNRVKKEGEELVQKLKAEMDKIRQMANELDQTGRGLEVRPQRSAAQRARELLYPNVQHP